MSRRGPKQDDWDDLERLFRSEYSRLVIVLRAKTRDRAAAEELAQEAFATAVRHWPRVRKYDDPKAWLWLVALRRARRWRRPPASVQAADHASDHWAEYERLIDATDAVERLPRRQREVIELHYFVDLSVDQIAARLSISSGTVKSTLHDARVALRGAINE
jgi:RNA polymerase sigma-70 factor, ECF subfamily